MNLRAAGLVAVLVGGACWVARWGAHLAGSDPGWEVTAHWLGLGSLVLGVAALGAGLVSSSVPWLRAVVAVAFPALAWSVYTVLSRGERATFDGVLGVLLVVGSAAAFVRGRSGRSGPNSRGGRTGPAGSRERPGRHGSHAAR